MVNRHNLSTDWNNEAYVSLHLVQAILKQAGIAQRGWHPEFKIKEAGSHVYADFRIEDIDRHIEFLIEVKSAKNPIDDAARFQLQSSYLFHSKIRYGLLIDPFSIEIHEFAHGTAHLKAQYAIADPTQIQPIASFVKNFLDTLIMRTITINASKGGVGKTTLTVNLAYELAKQGHRVLVIDLDDQANASLTLGVNKAEEFAQASSMSAYRELLESLAGRKEVLDFIKIGSRDADLAEYRACIYPITGAFQPESTGKIDILPSSYKTKLTSLPDNPVSHKFLNMGLKKLAGDYDYVLIDTAPSFNKIAWSAHFAAKYILIPSQMEYLSAFGIQNVIQNLHDVQQDTDNQRGNVLGIVPMMVENTVLSTTIESYIKETLPSVPLLPKIRNSTHFGQASFARIPLSLYALKHSTAPAKSAAQQMVELTNEVVKLIDQKEGSSAKETPPVKRPRGLKKLL